MPQRARHDWLDKCEHPTAVRYIGRIGKRKGLYVGLELLDYSEGLTSGEFEGVRYFRCDTHAMQTLLAS